MSIPRKCEASKKAIVVAQLVVWALVLAFAPQAHAKKHQSASIKQFGNWPTGTSPEEIGRRVAERYCCERLHQSASPSSNAHHYLSRSLHLVWRAHLRAVDPRHRSQAAAYQAFEPLFGERASLIPKPNHVDNTVFGTVPLGIYIETKDPQCLELGKLIADAQWQDAVGDGLTSQTRYWIDDMYMITEVEVQAYRATGDHKYLDRAAHEMSVYLDKLQQSNGLFYHAPDVPFFWGRGNGWVAAGMTELLRSMPQDHPDRRHILNSYRKMLATLLKYQNQDGTWNQLIDHPEAWPETSSTGMFTFAMITGVRNGWLDKKTYAPAARKAWLGLVHYIDARGDISNVCEGTNKKNDPNYYLTRARNTGDLHGEAPILWSTSALLR